MATFKFNSGIIMKKILLILIFLICGIVSAQNPAYFFNGRVDVPRTTAQILATASPVEGLAFMSSDTDTLWRYQGGVWVDTGIGGDGTWGSITGTLSDQTDLQSALDAKLESGDNVSELVNDVPYLTSSSLTNYVTTNTAQTITGSKTLTATTTIRDAVFRIQDTSVSSDVDMFIQGTPGVDEEFVMNPSDAGSTLSYDFEAEEWQIDDTAISTGGGGTSLPVDDTTALVQDPSDNTKQVRIDAGNVATSTTAALSVSGNNRFQTLLSVNRGPGGSDGASFSLHSFDGLTTYGAIDYNPTTSQVRMGNATSSEFFVLNDSGGASLNTDLTATSFIKSGAGSTDVLLGDGTTTTLTAASIPIVDAAGHYTGTDVEAMGQEIGADLADRPTSLGTGRTSPLQYSDIFGQTQDDYNTDGTGSAGDLIIITDASPAEVVETATIAMDGWKMYDDQTADAATITLSDCDPGETLTVYINRASAPSLAGTGLTFNQLPNTTAFASATTMMIIFEVAYDGTTIDYYYVER